MTLTKLNKDQIQKIVLSTLGFIGLIYCYFNFFLGPLNRSREAMSKTIGELQAKTASSISEMKEDRQARGQGQGSDSPLRSVQADYCGRRADRLVPAQDAHILSATTASTRPRCASSRAPTSRSPSCRTWLKDGWVIELPQSEYRRPRQSDR